MMTVEVCHFGQALQVHTWHFQSKLLLMIIMIYGDHTGIYVMMNINWVMSEHLVCLSDNNDDD